MRIAVTGAAGWVGSFVMKELVAHGHEALALDIRAPEEEVGPYIEADLLDAQALERAFRGCDAVVHLAAIPDPGIVSPEELFKVNVLGTMHALEAATRAHVRRFVSASSDAALGFSFRVNEIRPDYLPIDEAHPVQPEDEYGLGKVLMEEMCRSYSRRGALSTICLRTCWVWDLSLGHIERLSNPRGTERILWMYVHVLDAARAYRLACEAPDISNATLWIAAKDSFTAFPTPELIARYYPGVPLRSEIPKFGSTVDGSLARRLLGWEPAHSWRDVVPEGTVAHQMDL